MKSVFCERRKFTVILFAAALAATFLLALLLPVSARSAVAEKSSDFAPPSKEQTQTIYHMFDDPAALGTDGDFLYVLDGKSIKAFSLSDFSQTDYTADIETSPTAFSVRGATAVTVEDRKTYVHNADGKNPVFEEFAVTDVFIDETHIYAQTADNKIIKKSRTEDSAETYETSFTIKKFAVAGGAIYFTAKHGSSRRDDILYFTEEGGTALAVENLPEIIDMYPCGNMLAVSDAQNLTLYSRGIDELIIERRTELFSDAVSIACSENGIFILDTNKAVTRYRASLDEKTCVLASASDELGFFSSPTDVISRKNKTYAVDRNNNRIVIHDGENYSVIDSRMFRPVAVTVDHVGNIYAAYSENKIAVFDAEGTRTSAPESETVSVENKDGESINRIAIADIKCDSKANLYMLSTSGSLFVRPSGEASFKPVDGAGENVKLLDVSPNSAYVFFAQAESDGSTSIKFIGSSGIKTAVSNIKNVIDFAADADNSVYVLFEGNKIDRYDAASEYKMTKSETIDNGYYASLTRITVSNVSNNAVSYRDLILTETTRHRISVVSCGLFGVDAGDVSTPPQIDNRPTPVYGSAPLIRTITNPAGAEVYAQSSEVTLLRTLPYGYKVIVPFFDESAAYSLILADNVILGSSDYNKDPIITGYVNNEFLSDPLPYTDDHESECSAWISSVPVYKYPSRQAPKIDESAEKGTSFKFLDFVYEETLGGVVYGYTDNFPDSDELLNNRKWYRVLVEKDGVNYEGYVVASTVSVLSGNPDMSIRPQVNAEIIAKDKSVPTAGAIVYKKTDDGEYVADNRFEPLPVGTKVEVIGAFDSSEPYTQIAFYTQNGTVTAYVETANIKYQGVNVVKIVAIVIIIITTVLIIVLCTRIYFVRRNKSKSSESFK